MSQNELRLPAIEIRQGPNRALYNFGVDGKLLAKFASVSRLNRPDGVDLDGYQRPEVLSHIAEIRAYLESREPMIPNSLVIAFDKRVRFEPMGNITGISYASTGTIVIPLTSEDGSRPGWIVDGQQRAAAIRDARISDFPVSVVSFITDDIQEQREQFILVNSTKPLPKGLIYELLPETESRLPSLLQRRRFPAYLSQRLNLDTDSPLFRLIKTPTNPDGVIKDNSILKMIENSLYDGILYRFRDPMTARGDVDSMLRVLKNYWEAVRRVFPDAWGLPPRRSRLMHGAGMVCMGFVMDAIADRNRDQSIPTVETFQADLEPLVETCSWTSGYWNFGPGAQKKWNELQNLSRDIQLLANYLLVEYRQRVWG